jgi:small subunit ribosomal protein S4
MARYTGPVCRLCRREGMKLFLKGHQVLSAISARSRSATSPPASMAAEPQGQDRWLRPAVAREAEGQAHLLHPRGQFRAYYEKASRRRRHRRLLMQQLERRLDNVAFRLGFAISRRQARQVVRHGHVEVNGRKVNIPSYPGERGRRDRHSRRQQEAGYCRSGQRVRGSHHSRRRGCRSTSPNLTGKVVALPKRERRQLPVNEQLIVELYSK